MADSLLTRSLKLVTSRFCGPVVPVRSHERL